MQISLEKSDFVGTKKVERERERERERDARNMTSKTS
jgi:glycine cleavage system aminomethyltransferase T